MLILYSTKITIGIELNIDFNALSLQRVNSTSKMADIELPEYIEDVEDNEKAKRLSAQERKALMATTQLTELEMVELWNQYKFNFPTGKVNLKQLKQLVRKVSYNARNFELSPQNSNDFQTLCTGSAPFIISLRGKVDDCSFWCLGYKKVCLRCLKGYQTPLALDMM